MTSSSSPPALPTSMKDIIESAADGFIVDKLDTYEATIALMFAPERTATLSWTPLHAPWRFTLKGALPAHEGKLVLRPERGIGGAVSAVGEIEVQDDVVDKAWVVRGDAPGLLLAMLPELRTLADTAPSIEVIADVVISFNELSAEKAKRAVTGALALWHKAAFR